MTIRIKLVLSFSVLIFLVCCMGLSMIMLNSRTGKLSSRMYNDYSRLSFWKDLYGDFDSACMKLGKIDKGSYADFKKLYPELENSLNDESILQEKVLATRANYQRLLPLLFKGNVLRNKNVATEINIVVNSLKQDFLSYVSFYEDDIVLLNKNMEVDGKIGLIMPIVLALVTVVVGMFMVIMLFRSIVHPINILQAGTQLISDGNIDHQVEIVSKDEIGQLSQSFNQMLNSLKNLQLQVVQMDRMSSIGQLAGGVAHEINNPLTGVLGQAQLLLERLPQDSPYRSTVEKIENAAQRCRMIVRALLDFAREKNYKFQSTNMAELIEESLSFTRSEMSSKKIQIEEDIPDPLPDITASAGHLQQVVLNIINNAIHAMPEGGKLTIAVNIIDKNMMDISFTDTGQGIKKVNIDHVFDPFFTTKEVGKGTGLGLTISYGIIQRHRGEIIVKSDGENKGATFTVRLPIDIVKHEENNEQMDIIKGLEVGDEEINPPPKSAES